MANLFSRIHHRAKTVWPVKMIKHKPGADLTDDIQTDNVDLDSEDPRLIARFSSLVGHVKKNLIDLKSLKNKF